MGKTQGARRSRSPNSEEEQEHRPQVWPPPGPHRSVLPETLRPAVCTRARRASAGRHCARRGLRLGCTWPQGRDLGGGGQVRVTRLVMGG